MNEISTKPTYNIEFLIALPFWLEFPNGEIFYKNYQHKHFTIEILQNFWKILFISKIDVGSFLLKESEVIDPKFMRPKLDYTDYYRLSWYEEELKLQRQYFPEKLQTVLSISLNQVNFNNRIEILNYLRDQNNRIWEIIKNVIRFFLSNYIYFKTQTNRKFHSVRTISENYYTRDNTFIYIISSIDKSKTPLDIGTLQLKLREKHNLPNFLAGEKMIKSFRRKIFCSSGLKQNLRERLRVLINFAKIHRDMNSLILNTSIYLERTSLQFLSFKKGIKTWELDILFKYKGLSHYVESQLSYLIEDKSYVDNVKDAIEIVKVRNQIIHDGRVVTYNKDLEIKCDNIIKLINYIEKFMDPTINEEEEYILNHNLLGTFGDIDSEHNIGYIVLPLSKSEQLFIDKNFCKFNKSVKIADFEEVEIEETYSALFRAFYHDNNLFILMCLHPTRFSVNLNNLQIIFQQLDHLWKKSWEKITFKFLYLNMPEGFLELIKKLMKIRIRDLELKNYNIEFTKIESNDPIFLNNS